jgi:hypothetical protein
VGARAPSDLARAAIVVKFLAVIGAFSVELNKRTGIQVMRSG